MATAMNLEAEAYHYPPELIALLVQAIPLLCRAKKDVFLFFRGSGVAEEAYEDLRQQWAKDPATVSKYQITRTLLGRMNDAGDSMIRARRVLLRRVVEFDDYAVCWPDDQAKARGFVAEVAALVNVKDSFTRMTNERDAEARDRQAQHRLLLQQQHAVDSALQTAHDAFLALFRLSDPHKRGKSLEIALTMFFEAAGFLVREPFALRAVGSGSVIEQIDGVIEFDGQLYLAEMKWHNERLGRADISPHLVKVFARADARAVIISGSGYTESAVETAREALQQKVVVLCGLEEIVALLEQREDLGRWFRRKVQAAIIDKQPLLRIGRGP